MQQTHWFSLSLSLSLYLCLSLTVETIWQQMCLSLDCLVQYLLMSLGDQAHMKDPLLGFHLKGRVGHQNRASPYGRWPVALLLAQLKQPKTLLGYSTHAQWTSSSLNHSWSQEGEPRTCTWGQIYWVMHMQAYKLNTVIKEWACGLSGLKHPWCMFDKCSFNFFFVFKSINIILI